MCRQLLIFVFGLAFAGSAFAISPSIELMRPIEPIAPIAPIVLPVSQNFTSVQLCQGEIATSPEFNYIVEAYVHTSAVSGSAETYTDAQAFVSLSRQTTNNVFRRTAESASVESSISSTTGALEITVNTSGFSSCQDCFVLKITNGSASGRVLTGTIQFTGQSTVFPLQCGTID